MRELIIPKAFFIEMPKDLQQKIIENTIKNDAFLALPMMERLAQIKIERPIYHKAQIQQIDKLLGDGYTLTEIRERPVWGQGDGEYLYFEMTNGQQSIKSNVSGEIVLVLPDTEATTPPSPS